MHTLADLEQKYWYALYSGTVWMKMTHEDYFVRYGVLCKGSSGLCYCSYWLHGHVYMVLFTSSEKCNWTKANINQEVLKKAAHANKVEGNNMHQK